MAGWPETAAEFKGLKHLRVHDLESLLQFTQMETHIKSSCMDEWGTCLQWSANTKYQAAGTASRQSVEVMMRSAEGVIRQLSAKPGLEAVKVSDADEPFVKLWALAQEIEIEKGNFILFALCHRRGSPESADLVVAAHWLDAASRSGARFIADKITGVLKGDELKCVSGLIVLEPKHEVVLRLSASLNITGGKFWLENPVSTINGLCIGRALIIKCRKPDA